MRSLISKAAVAALILSSAIGVSLAQSPGYSNDGREPATVLNDGTLPIPAPPQLQTSAPAKVDRMSTASIHPQAVHSAMRPRLTAVVADLNRIDHRIRVDRDRGYLTAHERNVVRSESHEIRNAAFRTADRHDGALPRHAYNSYLREIRDLGGQVHRLSTNTARA